MKTRRRAIKYKTIKRVGKGELFYAFHTGLRKGVDTKVSCMAWTGVGLLADPQRSLMVELACERLPKTIRCEGDALNPHHEDANQIGVLGIAILAHVLDSIDHTDLKEHGKARVSSRKDLWGDWDNVIESQYRGVGSMLEVGLSIEREGWEANLRLPVLKARHPWAGLAYFLYDTYDPQVDPE